MQISFRNWQHTPISYLSSDGALQLRLITWVCIGVPRPFPCRGKRRVAACNCRTRCKYRHVWGQGSTRCTQVTQPVNLLIFCFLPRKQFHLDWSTLLQLQTSPSLLFTPITSSYTLRPILAQGAELGEQLKRRGGARPFKVYFFRHTPLKPMLTYWSSWNLDNFHLVFDIVN